MLTFILLITLSAIFIPVGSIIYKKTFEDGLAAAFLSVGIMSLFLAIGFGISLINIGTRFEDIQNRYETVQIMVDSYGGQDFGNMNALTESVVSINNTIAAHKAHYNSLWSGLWYSEEIGKLEPIRFGLKKTVPDN